LLLAQIGYAEPTQAAIDAAVAANLQFIEQLQAIRDRELDGLLAEAETEHKTLIYCTVFDGAVSIINGLALA
jgi:hypothetical protein